MDHKLRHLLELLDDESDTVQRALFKEFIAYGQALEEELDRFEGMTQEQREKIYRLLVKYKEEWLKETWPSWFHLEGEENKLEKAHSILADYQNGLTYHVKLTPVLDYLANEYDELYSKRDPFQLAHFLFKSKGLKGANTDYYNPANSNLVAVIEEKQGIPISLTCIYILVGKRLGMTIEGCGYPGHFLARIYANSRMHLVDCFNSGRVLSDQDVLNLNPDSTDELNDILHQKPGAEVIMIRVLNNLVKAYEEVNQPENRDLIIELLKMMGQGEEPE